jgi:hypothetical protein
VDFEKRDVLPIRRPQVMLEGQAAMLGANYLSPEESLALLIALRSSKLYRADQHSYLLYPDRRLPRYVEKNNLPAKFVARSPLLNLLLADGNRLLIERDVAGVCHFNPRISNSGDAKRILDQLAGAGYARSVKRESARLLELFEQMFDHRSFTGRSGTFFGYEGLGCIYWHMVSKLLLATVETFLRADGQPAARLAACYRNLRAGIGDFKTPENYGGFPMDPYSHTPAHTGARQPGLTGQVKEDILCRFGELGVTVHRGQIQFKPQLLSAGEFLEQPDTFSFVDVAGKTFKLRLKAGSLAFTYCQVPIIYELADKSRLTIALADGSTQRQDLPVLDGNASRDIFERSGKIKFIVAGVRLPSWKNKPIRS